MPGWSLVVELVRALVFAVAHLCGNSIGGAILTVSLLVRIALLPLTLRAARRMLAHQAQLAKIAPELARLRALHVNDHAALAESTMELHRRHGISLLPSGMFGAMLVQMPVGAALYQAFASGLGPRLSFLWIGDLARPDAVVATAAALLTGTATALGTAAPSRSAIVLSTTITFVLAWRLSASVGLYWVASNTVGVAQSLILRRQPASS